jgi:hypothetical protein
VLIGLLDSDVDADADFICRKVLNMRLFPNEKNGKAWDQNVSLWIFPLCNFSKSGPLCFGKSTKDSQFPF